MRNVSTNRNETLSANDGIPREESSRIHAVCRNRSSSVTLGDDESDGGKGPRDEDPWCQASCNAGRVSTRLSLHQSSTPGTPYVVRRPLKGMEWAVSMGSGKAFVRKSSCGDSRPPFRDLVSLTKSSESFTKYVSCQTHQRLRSEHQKRQLNEALWNQFAHSRSCTYDCEWRWLERC